MALVGIINGLNHFLKISSDVPVDWDGKGSYTLRLNAAYLIFGYLFIVIGIVGAYIAYNSGKNDAELMAATALGLMLIASIFCLMWHYNHKVTFDDKTITGKSYYGRSVNLNWSDIEKVKFSKGLGMLVLTDYRNKTIKAHMHLVGFSDFTRIVLNRKKLTTEEIQLPPDLWPKTD